MPRSPSTYSLPPGTTPQQPNSVISSSMFNAFADDVAQTFNTPQPIAYGGTNATNAADARTNLGIPADVGQMATVVETLKDFVVNGDMQVSQENGNNSGTTNGFFGADQWATYRVTSAGVITTQRIAARTPAGGSYRYRVTITTPDASLAAGEYLTITQPLEGSNVRSFLYGTASASASVLRFGFKGPAGTYAARFGNSAANRSFVGLFTISGGQANTDTVQNIAIPGDTTGTWLTADGVIGITLDIVLACGSTFQGATGWQAGNILGTSAVSNGMGTGSSVFELFDVGLKLDPDATGVYGRYVVGEVDADYRSERYYQTSYSTGNLPGVPYTIAPSILVTPVAGGICSISWPVLMCKGGAVRLYSPVTGAIDKARLANTAADVNAVYVNSGSKGAQLSIDSIADGVLLFHWAVNARLS